MFLGDLEVPIGAPPSHYPVAAIVEGKPGAWPALLASSFQRTLVIAPGIWLGFRLSGARPKLQQVVAGAASASTLITLTLFATYAYQKRKELSGG